MSEINRYAVLYYGMIINIIKWDGISEYNPGNDYVLVKITTDKDVSIGWVYDVDTNTFSEV